MPKPGPYQVDFRGELILSLPQTIFSEHALSSGSSSGLSKPSFADALPLSYHDTKLVRMLRSTPDFDQLRAAKING